MLKKAIVMGEGEIMEELDSRENECLSQSPNLDAALETAEGSDADFQETMLACEKLLISQALDVHKSTRALAKYLNLSQSSVVRKLKIHGLTQRLKRKARK